MNATVHKYIYLKLLSFNSCWLQRLIVPCLPHYFLLKLGYNRTKSTDHLTWFINIDIHLQDFPHGEGEKLPLEESFSSVPCHWSIRTLTASYRDVYLCIECALCKLQVVRCLQLIIRLSSKTTRFFWKMCFFLSLSLVRVAELLEIIGSPGLQSENQVQYMLLFTTPSLQQLFLCSSLYLSMLQSQSFSVSFCYSYLSAFSLLIHFCVTSGIVCIIL